MCKVNSLFLLVCYLWHVYQEINRKTHSTSNKDLWQCVWNLLFCGSIRTRVFCSKLKCGCLLLHCATTAALCNWSEWVVRSELSNQSFFPTHIFDSRDRQQAFLCQQTTFIEESAFNTQTTSSLRPHGLVVRSADQLHLDLGSLLGYTVVRKNWKPANPIEVFYRARSLFQCTVFLVTTWMLCPNQQLRADSVSACICTYACTAGASWQLLKGQCVQVVSTILPAGIL